MVTGIFAKSKVPYKITGEMENNYRNSLGEWSFNFDFYNISNLKVNSFTLVFYLFDEEGNLAIKNRNSIVFKVEESVPPYAYFSDYFILDNYLSEVPEYPYEIDYLYVSFIEYEDGSFWRDPFGLKIY